MNQSESQLAAEKLTGLKTDFGLNLIADWGPRNSDGSGEWNAG